MVPLVLCVPSELAEGEQRPAVLVVDERGKRVAFKRGLVERLRAEQSRLRREGCYPMPTATEVFSAPIIPNVYELLLCNRVFNWASKSKLPENCLDPSLKVQVFTSVPD